MKPVHLRLVDDHTSAARSTDAPAASESQDGFEPVSVEADLAEVVQNLRSAWVAHMAGYWGDIHPIDKKAGNELEQRVATALCDGFFHFSQLLCGFEVLLLQGKHLSVVSEKSILGLEQLVVELRNDRADLVEISKANGRLGKLLCHADGRGCDADQ